MHAHFPVKTVFGLLIVMLLLIGPGLTAGDGAASPGAAPTADAKAEAARDEAPKPLTEAEKQKKLEENVTQGALRIVQTTGEIVECPLKHTDVKAEISGFLARVKVTQTFVNPSMENIEAVYVFPLPHEAAVDDMTMVIGERRIVGVIKKRADARAIYEQAIAAGQTAALLEQERPNIFTQSVGNIEPGQEINIEISYVDVLRYDMGEYEFSFPMVVGPRYNPGDATSPPPAKPVELEGVTAPLSPDTTDVPDGSKINPPVLKPGFRTGHDISLSVKLNAGVPITGLEIPTHKAELERDGDRKAYAVLSKQDSLPNKDFVLKYNVVGEKPEMAVLAHTGETAGSGYFMLMVQPKEDEKLKQMPPREIVFLVDVSGSMSGQPTQKVKQCMQHMLQQCRPNKDTMQLVTFAGSANALWTKPVPVNKEHVEAALNFTRGYNAGGGTNMIKGIKMAIDQPLDKERMRIVVLLTDGYIGNEAQIIEHVGKHCGDQIRFWAVGIGSSPNMHLIDGVAKQGGGMGKKLNLNDDAQELAEEIMIRITRAQLANVAIDWGKLEVNETYPVKIPELWAGRPIILYGRYRGGGETTITVSGTVEGEAASWPLTCELPRKEEKNDVLAKVWARQKIEELMHQTYYAGSPEVEQLVTDIALEFRLMSQYTSFVAVDESKVGDLEVPAQPPRRMMVPVPLPAGTQYQGFFGAADDDGIAAGGPVVMFGGDKKEAESAAKGGYRGWSAAPRYRKAYNAPAPMMPAPGIAPTGMGGGSGGETPAATMGRRRATTASRPYSYGARQVQQHGQLNTKLRADRSDALRDEATAEEAADYQSNINAMAQPLQQLATEGRKLLEQAKTAQKQDKPAEARALLEQAVFLLNAGSVVDYHAHYQASEALGLLQAQREAHVTALAEKHAALGRKLDLVLRDTTVADALDRIAKQAKVKIDLVEGSVADAATLEATRRLHVDYLDLRRATLAQALEWLLQPNRLDWSIGEAGITVASARRMDRESCWVYDVSLIALPDGEELAKINDWQKRIKKATEEAEAFLKPIRAAHGVTKDDDHSITWYAPGQLLVIGDAKFHAAVAQTLAQLRSDKGQIAKELEALRQTTLTRFRARHAAAAKRQEQALAREMAWRLDAFSWRVLADAAGGQLDDETLTQLRIAWASPQVETLIAGEGAGLAFRSQWAIQEAALAMPLNGGLQKLAAIAMQKTDKRAGEVLEALKKNPDDQGAYPAALYAAMARRGDEQFRSTALPLLGAQVKDSKLNTVRHLARAILGSPGEADAKAIAKLIEGGVGGDDMVVLTALAARRTGGETWKTFRAAARDMLGKQPLPGSVVVFVNRLASTRMPLLAMAD